MYIGSKMRLYIGSKMYIFETKSENQNVAKLIN